MTGVVRLADCLRGNTVAQDKSRPTDRPSFPLACSCELKVRPDLSRVTIEGLSLAETFLTPTVTTLPWGSS